MLLVAAQQSDTVFENLSEQGFASVAEVDEVDRQAGRRGEFFDERDLSCGLEWSGCSHSQVDVAVCGGTSGCTRTEQDRQANAPMLGERFLEGSCKIVEAGRVHERIMGGVGRGCKATAFRMKGRSGKLQMIRTVSP
jgi:hypothetical protein